MKVNLIDANGILYRMHHGMQPLTRSDGTLVSAVYGLTRAVLNMRVAHPEYKCVAIWDNDEPTFRDKLYPAYKKNRSARPPEIPPQRVIAMNLMEDLGVKNITVSGFEADDVIATLALHAERSIVTTVDKDLMQTFSEKTAIYNPVLGEFVGDRYMFKKFRTSEPGLIPLIQAFIGDGSDGFPGVPGVGPVKAEAIIAEARSKWSSLNLEASTNLDLLGVILDRAKHEKKGVMWANIRSTKDMLPVFLELATLRTDALDDVQSVLDAVGAMCYDGDVAKTALEKQEFKSLLTAI